MNKKFSIVTMSFAVVYLLSFSACCHKSINVGGNVICHETLCGERAKTGCSPDGLLTKKFLVQGFPLSANSTGAEYLGQLWYMDSPDITDQCLQTNGFNLTPADYSQTYMHEMQIDRISDTKLYASVQARAEGTLKAAKVDNSPTIAANIAASVVSNLKNKNFSKASYKILNLNDSFLDTIQARFPKCFAEYTGEKPTSLFIKSVAVITSEGKFDGLSSTEIDATIDSELDNAKIDNHALNASIKANVRMGIKRKVEESIKTQLKEHSRVFALAFWMPREFTKKNDKRGDICIENLGCMKRPE